MLDELKKHLYVGFGLVITAIMLVISVALFLGMFGALFSGHFGSAFLLLVASAVSFSLVSYMLNRW